MFLFAEAPLRNSKATGKSTSDQSDPDICGAPLLQHSSFGSISNGMRSPNVNKLRSVVSECVKWLLFAMLISL
jgi:hypothetical protein